MSESSAGKKETTSVAREAVKWTYSGGKGMRAIEEELLASSFKLLS